MAQTTVNDRERHAHWMRQAAGCRRTFSKTHDPFWAAAARKSVATARAYRAA